MIGKRRKRRGVGKDFMRYSLRHQQEVLFAEYMTEMNELKYESRLEFGTNSNPSRTAIWDETRKILIDGLPQRPSTPVVRPAPVITNPRFDPRELYPCSQKNGRYNCLIP